MIELGEKPIQGIMTLVPTVFDDKGELDLEGFKENIAFLEKAGMHGIIAMASVGEYFQLDREEYNRVVDAAVDACQKMTCVCGSHYQNTRECIRRTKYAEDAGADGVMILPPYYANYLDEEACYNHYKLVHEATSKIQLMAYNYAGGAGIFMSPDLFGRLLRDFKRITAVKECTPALQMGELIRRYGDRLNVLAGVETALFACMFLGGKGSIALWGTSIPKFLLEFYEACKNKNWDKALEFHLKLTKHIYPFRNDPRLRIWNEGMKSLHNEAGRRAGYMREPYLQAPPELRAFHREWLKEIAVVK